MKTVRFTQVVQRSGRPRVHSLWVAPEKDPELVQARKADRVMTVAPGEPGKADIGIVGFDASRKPGSEILIFPKSLKPFDGDRVVGVKFDLVDQPGVLPAAERERWTAPPKKRGKADRHAISGPSLAAKGVPETERAMVHDVDRRTRPPAKPAKRVPRDVPTAPSGLLREVRAALKELQQGKAVAAYQRLERAAAEAEDSL